MPHQESVTVIDRIKPGQVETLKELLGMIADHGDNWHIIPFNRLSKLHFARLVVFDETKDLDGNTIPAQLALLTNIDAPTAAHLQELVDIGGDGVDRVFGLCEGFPAPTKRTPESRLSYLRQHMAPTRAFYVNRNGRSVQQVRQEDSLRKTINDFLDSQDFSDRDSMEVHASIQQFVRDTPELRWATSAAERPALSWRIRERLHQVFGIVLVLVLAPILLASLPIWLILLRIHEVGDKPDPSSADPDTIKAFRADEDHGGQNQVMAVGLFKPGLFRKITATIILRLADYAVRHIYNLGILSGLSTIHFARWVGLDEGRRMFFSSNYDGSLESYMNDFIDKAAWGLNGIFSSGDGFPKTSFLFCGGITDEQAYKRFLPTRQVQSRVWYSAYKDLSTKNISNNAEIRKGLFAKLNPAETKIWLRRFGAGNQLPRPGFVARILDNIPWNKLCRYSS